MGYLDYRHCLKIGEILGFYLEPSVRSKRIGRHLLRWVSADLRECDCERVDIEIYADNVASLRASEAAGFHCDPGANHTEDGRALCRVTRFLSRFKRFSEVDPRFLALKRGDFHLHHVAIAEALIDRLSEIQGVEVILGLGSIGRGFADQWSDIDLAVLGRGINVCELWRGEIWSSGLSLDFSIVDFDSSPPADWDDTRKQAFQESVVLYEDSPVKAQLLANALLFSSEKRNLQIYRVLLGLGWIGFQPRAWTGKDVYGYRWSIPHDLWLRRGCLASAQATVDQALDLAIQLMYLANNRYVPDLKWRRYLLSGLAWLPIGVAELIWEVENRFFEVASFQARSDAVLTLIEEIVSYLESLGEISGKIYESFIHSEKEY